MIQFYNISFSIANAKHVDTRLFFILLVIRNSWLQ